MPLMLPAPSLSLVSECLLISSTSLMVFVVRSVLVLLCTFLTDLSTTSRAKLLLDFSESCLEVEYVNSPEAVMTTGP